MNAVIGRIVYDLMFKMGVEPPDLASLHANGFIACAIERTGEALNNDVIAGNVGHVNVSAANVGVRQNSTSGRQPGD